MSLREELEHFVAQSRAQLPPDVLTALEHSIDQLKSSGINERALSVGDRAPDFTLCNALGRPVALSNLLRRGPLIISFYRGNWCPFCNLELRAYQRLIGDIRAASGDFIAISPQTPDRSLTISEKNALAFDVLSDPGNMTARAFGITHHVPEIVRRIVASFGDRLAAYNGGNDEHLPVPATFVIDRDGWIVDAHVDPDYRKRLEPSEALAAVRGLADRAPVGRVRQAWNFAGRT
jgi:peroxiredoxin